MAERLPVAARRKVVADLLALFGLLVAGMWAVQMLVGAQALQLDPTALRGDDKATLLSVSGVVLLIVVIGMAIGIIARRLGSPLPSPVPRRVVGWTLVGLYAGFVIWGARLTTKTGLGAFMLAELPFFIAGAAVVLAQPDEVKSEP